MIGFALYERDWRAGLGSRETRYRNSREIISILTTLVAVEKERKIQSRERLQK